MIASFNGIFRQWEGHLKVQNNEHLPPACDLDRASMWETGKEEPDTVSKVALEGCLDYDLPSGSTEHKQSAE